MEVFTTACGESTNGYNCRQSACIIEVANLQTSLLSLLGEAASIVPEHVALASNIRSVHEGSTSGPQARYKKSAATHSSGTRLPPIRVMI